ncbi:hypothetical protein AAG906_004150 [Vitis piasezkii]
MGALYIYYLPFYNCIHRRCCKSLILFPSKFFSGCLQKKKNGESGGYLHSETSQETPGGYRCVSDSDQVRALTTHPPSTFTHLEALVIFYPLAGRLHWIGGGRLELDCNALGLYSLQSSPKAKSMTMETSDQPQRSELSSFSGLQQSGLGISHTIADGLSALHFISEWAKIARGEQANSPPFLDRSKTTLMLKLSQDQVEKLKDKANKDRSPSDNKRPYTRYEAIAGHLEECGASLHSLGFASGKARQAIEKATHEYLQSSLVYEMSGGCDQFQEFPHRWVRQRAFYGNPNLEITRIYMGPGGIGYDGKVFVFRQGQDGSFVVALRLQVRHVDAFQKFFYEDI